MMRQPTIQKSKDGCGLGWDKRLLCAPSRKAHEKSRRTALRFDGRERGPESPEISLTEK
jgi:hypothetical protein